ncbi:hypothetical protein [Rufibacter sp. XAAS-G3-1]|uniref:hypothetical protein n=1 Tax=Rufibacter sp. XAAS-G3-1 TaxID=2729134 RepID=UPI0015E6D244|nr:hypothetical protein [Rufibacter sp. XAAS-G3-1]
MKHIMPFFAACALFAGVACSTYTSTTDPNDKGSGTALDAEVGSSTPAAAQAHPTTATTHASAETAPEAKADTTAAHAAEAAH